MKLLPYPNYKRASADWIGEIPEHWGLVSVRHAFVNLDYKRIPLAGETRADLEKTYPYYGASGVIDYVDDFIFNEPLILVAEDGANLLSRSSPLAFIASGKYWVNNHAHILKPLRGDLTYWEAVLQVYDYAPLVTGAAQPKLTADQLSGITIPNPPPDEQEMIAKFLDKATGKIDRLVGKKRELVEVLEEKLRALITRCVTRGLSPEAARAAGLNPNPKLKPSGIDWLGEIPEHWEVSPIKSVAKVGNGSTPKRDDDRYWENGDFPWLNSSNVNQDVVESSDQFVTSTALAECHLPIIDPPAVLVGITGQGKTRGTATLLMFRATINQHVAYLKPDDRKVNAPYLHRLLETAYDFLRNESDGGGSTKGAITCDQLANMKVALPPLNEQTVVSDFIESRLNRMQVLRSQIEEVIDRLLEYRSALITAAVTGKFDVREVKP